MHPGLIGGIAGAAIGLAGGVVGTCCSIRNTGGPRERAFVIRASAVLWIAGLLFLAALLLLPSPWRFLAWIPWAIAFPLGLARWNRVQRRIREKESPGAC